MSLDRTVALDLTIAQVATELNVSGRTVRRLIDSGELVSYRPRGMRLIRVRPEDLQAAKGRWRLDETATGGLSSSCSAESGSSAGSRPGAQSQTHNSLKASSVVKSLMRLT